MLAPQPFYETRGTPISVRQRLKALSDLGHEVDLLTYPLGEDVDMPGLVIHRLPNFFATRHIQIGPSWNKIFLDILMVFKAGRMLAKKKYDVIHSHEEAAFFAQALAKIFSVQHLADMHSVLSRQLKTYDFGGWWLPVKLFEALERWVIRNCDAIIPVGYDIESYVRDANPAAKQIRIDNLALNEVFAVSDPETNAAFRARNNLNGRKLVVYTGNFQPYQGLELLLSCVGIVKETYRNVRFFLVGAKKHELEPWTRKIREQNLEDYISVFEVVPSQDLVLYHENAEIFISPRLYGRTVPLKIYSYLQVGKPIVATDIPAHRDILSDDFALLVPPSKEEMARGILKILLAPEFGQALGNKAKMIAEERFNYETYLSKVKRVYAFLAPPSAEEQGLD